MIDKTWNADGFLFKHFLPMGTQMTGKQGTTFEGPTQIATAPSDIRVCILFCIFCCESALKLMSILGKDPLSGRGRCCSSCSHVVKCLLQDTAQHMESSILSGKSSSCVRRRPSNDGAYGGVEMFQRPWSWADGNPITILSPPAAMNQGEGDGPTAPLGVRVHFVQQRLSLEFSFFEISSACCPCSSRDEMLRSIFIHLIHAY